MVFEKVHTSNHYYKMMSEAVAIFQIKYSNLLPDRLHKYLGTLLPGLNSKIDTRLSSVIRFNMLKFVLINLNQPLSTQKADSNNLNMSMSIEVI